MTTRKRKLVALGIVVVMVSVTLSFTLYVHGFYSSSPSNLRVETYLSSSEINQGQNVSITVYVYNNGSNFLNLPANTKNFPFFYSDNYSRNYVQPLGIICGPYVIGLAEVAGDYVMNNLTNGTPLIVGAPVVIDCPAEPNNFLPPALQFEPHSYNATQRYPFGSSTQVTMKETIVVSGYWTVSNGNYTHHTFAPGTYTFVGEDSWGLASIQHLTVR